jgi:hypothetical protein
MNYEQYASQYRGAIEKLGGMLYDTVAFVTAATLQLTFFNAIPANPSVGNMELAGQLPNPKGFLIRAIKVNILQHPMSMARTAAGTVQPGALDNIAQILNTGVLTLTIGTKRYAQFPIWMLPGGCGVYGVQASDGDVADPGEIQDFATNGYPDPHNSFNLSLPIFIGPGINFNAIIQWPAPAIATAGAIAVPIRVILDGDLVRPIQ